MADYTPLRGDRHNCVEQSACIAECRLHRRVAALRPTFGPNWGPARATVDGRCSVLSDVQHWLVLTSIVCITRLGRAGLSIHAEAVHGSFMMRTERMTRRC